MIDTSSLLDLPSLPLVIENVKESIQFFGDAFDQLQDFADRSNELPSADMNAQFLMVLDGLDSLKLKQGEAFDGLQNELISFRKMEGLG
ncbi:hypothetical protein D3C78_1294970 [compost metagenome]